MTTEPTATTLSEMQLVHLAHVRLRALMYPDPDLDFLLELVDVLDARVTSLTAGRDGGAPSALPDYGADCGTDRWGEPDWPVNPDE